MPLRARYPYLYDDRPTWDRSRGREQYVPGPVGIYTPPDDCDHPETARVTAGWPGKVARCHDCGLYLGRDGQWATVMA
jgi:hypothetical protein